MVNSIQLAIGLAWGLVSAFCLCPLHHSAIQLIQKWEYVGDWYRYAHSRTCDDSPSQEEFFMANIAWII